MASGCTDQKENKQVLNYYNSSSVFFNYPDTWDVARSIEVAGAEVVIVTDPTASKYINESSTREELESLNITNGALFMYVKIPKNLDANLNSTVNEALQKLTQKGAKITKVTTTNVSGIVANETSLTRTGEGVTSEGKVIAFERNENVYALILISAGSTYESQKKNFDLILSSLQFT
ncbi:hypothetical protein FGU46_08965 [Methanobacterium sp. CWC-01]|uniref:hypothetical protein n=1 Tax=Methanobacterium aridiramus TaxID=2584467 RepID=UPI002574BBEB|nr:hypothetical protein [Methanobacterium sp. CWC-01]WJI10205.1 hypothetical protein FGU46_08965 [Methanobacterium sp. CWC-01]